MRPDSANWRAVKLYDQSSLNAVLANGHAIAMEASSAAQQASGMRISRRRSHAMPRRRLRSGNALPAAGARNSIVASVLINVNPSGLRLAFLIPGGALEHLGDHSNSECFAFFGVYAALQSA